MTEPHMVHSLCRAWYLSHTRLLGLAKQQTCDRVKSVAKTAIIVRQHLNQKEISGMVQRNPTQIETAT